MSKAELVDRPVGAHDREGDDRLAGPAAEVVDVERDEARQEDQLGREHRQLVPGPQAEQRQPDPGEDPGALDAAGRADELGGPAHVLGLGRVAGEAERHVGLDGGRQLGRPAVEVRPGAVVALARADPACRRGGLLGGADARGTRAAAGPRRPW